VSYARGTLAAFVDAVVPETPDLADRGDEHVPGGLDAGLVDVLVEEINTIQPVHGGPLGAMGYETTPLAPVVAALLDAAAVELLLRQRAESGLQSPADAYASGPFCRLAPRDRLRAVRMLETEGVIPALAEKLDAPGLGTIQYLASALVALTETLYYGELTGDGETSQGWEQADYPGPADGYAVLLGYEVDAFEEDDY
jgi:hypothetical protein